MFASPVKLHHANQPCQRNGEEQKLYLVQVVRACPSLTSPFHTNPLLFSGHLHTMWAATGKFPANVVFYARKLLTMEDKGTIAIDFVDGETREKIADDDLPLYTNYMKETEQQVSDEKSMLVILHGLTGGSHETYVRALISHLRKTTNFEACVINARGCAKSKITSPKMFNAAITNDVREAITYLKARFPQRHLYAAGFSLGANILANYLGEEGYDSPFRAACLVSNPWNLETSSNTLRRGWWSREVYAATMGDSLRKTFESHLEMLAKNPLVDVERVRQTRYIRDFDQEFTAKVTGYETVGMYYRKASSVNKILDIKTPTLLLQAMDDPITTVEGVPWEEIEYNEFLILATTDAGGHIGWFESGGSRWFPKPIVEFLQNIEIMQN